MLVLSRKESESIIAYLSNGDEIKFTLPQYVGQQTRVGIDASDDEKFLREESSINNEPDI